MEASPLNVVFHILKLSSHLFMVSLDIPLCVPHRQEDELWFAIMEHSRAIKTPVWPPFLPRLGKHEVLSPSWAEVITRCFSVSVNSQGQHVYLTVLGTLLLSWLKKQLIIRNQQSHNQKYFSCQFMSCLWPWNIHLTIWKRDGSPWGQTEGQVMFPRWLVVDVSFYNLNRRRNKPFLFAFPFSKINIFIISSATLVLYFLPSVYILSAPGLMKLLLADLAKNNPFLYIHICVMYT